MHGRTPRRRHGADQHLTADAGVEDLLRELAPQLLGVLVRRYEDFAVCEDAVIDPDVVIASRDDLPAVITRLQPLGHQHEGGLGRPWEGSLHHCGCQICRFASCDLRILMDQPTESISSHDPPSRHGDS